MFASEAIFPPSHWKVTSAPATEPLTATEVKTWLKVDNTADDDLITILIQGAREWCERKCSLALITQTITEYFDYFPYWDTIQLSVSPLLTVTSIQCKDSAGATQTLDASAYYIVDTTASPSRIVKRDGATWPGTFGERNAVTIVYTAGFGAAAAVPAKLKMAMLLRIAENYNNRQDGPKTFRTAADEYLEQHREIWFR